eukprot:SAG22_NODE_5896_length_934_cov_2.426347_1_plen_47_part_10
MAQFEHFLPYYTRPHSTTSLPLSLPLLTLAAPTAAAATAAAAAAAPF